MAGQVLGPSYDAYVDVEAECGPTGHHGRFSEGWRDSISFGRDIQRREEKPK